jgi:hypothetical protein
MEDQIGGFFLGLKWVVAVVVVVVWRPPPPDRPSARLSVI